jgi:hypothetical protein
VASLRDPSQLPPEPVAEARLRPAAAGRAPDVSLRFGSQNRLRVLEESREAARFTDMGYESHVQSNAHKAVGIELLVPFQ